MFPSRVPVPYLFHIACVIRHHHKPAGFADRIVADFAYSVFRKAA
jgi:hypothetical protein